MTFREMKVRLDPSPEEFYTAFQGAVLNEHDGLRKVWSSSPLLTKVMRGPITATLADTLNLRHAIEYYGIDAILYREGDEINFRDPRYSYAKYISVAIEYENDCNDAHVEMNKLQILNVPLTVLITYPTSRAKATQLLTRYAQIVKDADVFGNASSERRQMAILGYEGTAWDAFVYSEGTFTPLMGALQTSVG